ncbi:MAG: hypothetical protein ACJASR_001430 [Psychroserpens sp.]|jgi:hypothetical protein
MFKFNFTNKKIISRNTSSYPIDLADVKEKSAFYEENPTDTSMDNYVINTLIPNIVDDWEESTNYLLLDQVIKAYVPDLQFINSNSLEIGLNYLNIREVNSIKYYPSNWNEEAIKTILNSTNYIITEELLKISSKLKIKKEYLPITLFNITNNLESEIQAGFASNDFSTLNPQIKEVLSMQAATAVDVRQGYCKGFYNEIIYELYEKFSIEKQLVSFI